MKAGNGSLDLLHGEEPFDLGYVDYIVMHYVGACAYILGGEQLKVVKKFVYLGSFVSVAVGVSDEIILGIVQVREVLAEYRLD